LEELKNRLIKLLPIPDKSEDYIITGKGEIQLNGDKLEIIYSWEATIPYQYPEKNESGELIFYP